MWSGTILAVLALASCGGTPPPDGETRALPDTLSGLALTRSVSGEEAQGLIAYLHPGPPAPAESEVGFYASDGERAVLYVSRFPSADTARAQLSLMSAMIGRGRAGFGHHTETEIGGIVVHAALSQGRAHFFFTRDRDVVWLAADPELARAALAELLDIPLDSLPAGERGG
jgi:hypothetical protein